MLDWTIIFPFVAGVLLVFQNAQNAELGSKTSIAFGAFVANVLAAFITFIVWMIQSNGASDINYWDSIGEAPSWSWLGGPFAIGFVLILTAIIPVIGSAVSSCCVITCQLIFSLLADHFAIFGFPYKEATTLRIVGTALALIAILSMSVVDHIRSNYSKINTIASSRGAMNLKYATFCVLAFVAGWLISTMSGMISALAERTTNAFASFITLFLASIGLGIYLLFDFFVMKNQFKPSDLLYLQWWAWVGGIGEAYFCTIAPFVIPRLGAAIFYSTTILAQVPTSIIVDHFGLLGVQKQHTHWNRWFGVLLMFISVYLVTFA
ncbi:hypothetical protein BC833DRAFT_647092 [Globomyces pollinis-pini]|nr:hypothetical protein BC833DRAFT_647092 [Globomyces pollinis-pini]